MSSLANLLVIGRAPLGAEAAAADLRVAGFDVAEAPYGADVNGFLTLLSPDVILVDLALPDCSGLETCRSAKNLVHGPGVIVLASQAGELERVTAFEAGADDFIAVPVSARELVLRVRAVLRRRQAHRPLSGSRFLRTGALALDADARTAEVDGAAIDLTLLEFRLLWTLASRSGGVQQRETLLRDVCGPEVKVEARTVDQHVKRLRRKLGVARKLLRTVRGVGYRFEPTVLASAGSGTMKAEYPV